MKSLASLAGGLAGACALTLVHEVTRRVEPAAPRMDLLGMSALSSLIKKGGGTPPKRDQLFDLTMAGDVAGNALYYSLAGAGNKKGVWLRGLLLGIAAGAGAVYLPGPLGLPERPSNRTTKTKLLALGLYAMGGLVAAAAIDLLKEKE
ncbi:MAG: hypothetical protein INR73_22885 [Williamsia sp.]|nr:hypothetical protein [Williamsia sp.]